jgi:RHS repeat-associated protein
VPPAGQKAARLYDALGRLTRLAEDYSGIDRYTDFAYDRASRLTRQTGYTNGTSGAENTDYAYNKAGVKTVVIYPDSGTVSFVLDSVSRVTRQTDPRSIALAFDYDPMGRLLTKHEGTNIYWTYGYNALGALTLARKGTSAGGDQVARTDRLYNGLGRLTKEDQTIRDAASKYVRYQHDKAGNMTYMEYPSGLAFGYTRTNLGQIDTVHRTAGGTNFASYTYVGDRVKRFRYLPTNEVTADRSYDGAGRLTRLTWSMTGKTYPDFSYAYDKAGNILTKTHNHRASNQTEVYDIDGLYRLADARYDFRTLTHNFEYDDLGNWLTYTNNATAQTRLHNEVNEITKIGTTEMLYDAAGNLTKDNAGGNGPYHTFYDAEKRLTRIERDDSTAVASYEYDALGRRIEFIDEIGSVTRRYYHDGDQVVQEYDASATPVLQRTYLWGNTIDELLYMKDDPNNYNFWVLHNHLYSPEVLLNGSYEIVERYDYDAYGQPVIYTGNGGDGDWWDGDETTSGTSAKGLVYLFTGRELDNLDGNTMKLYYYRARTYSPTLGRFLQRDPIGYVDGMNLYQYVASGPQRYGDPEGLMPPWSSIPRDWLRPPPSLTTQPGLTECPQDQAGSGPYGQLPGQRLIPTVPGEPFQPGTPQPWGVEGLHGIPSNLTTMQKLIFAAGQIARILANMAANTEVQILNGFIPVELYFGCELDPRHCGT